MAKILIVEDETLLRESYSMVLSVTPYEVHMAENGEQALKLCQETTFDLILLDLMMPRMSGTAFLEHMKKHGRKLPKTIIMSNLSSGEDLSKALSLGAYGSVVKADLSPQQLITMITDELTQRP
jgi:CheY-like chemotaxis protein